MKPGAEAERPEGDAEDAARLQRFVEHNDREALNAILRRHLDMAYRVARRLAGHEADAEDAVQSACVYLLRNAARYRGEGSVRAWFVSMVVSACRTKHREASRRERREQAAEREHAVESVSATEKQAEAREDRSRMFAALEHLPEHYRLPVWLHYIEGLTSVEVGKALGVSENTVRSQIRRGLDELRNALGLSGAQAAGLPEALAALPLQTAPAALGAALTALVFSKGAGIAAGAATAKAAVAAKSASAGTGALLGGATMKITAVVVLATAAATATVVAPRLMSQEGGLRGSGLSGGTKGGESKSAGAGNDGAALGSVEFGPSARRPLGWRGDGTGRFPGATPPLTWERKSSGEMKNILWATRLPSTGVSSPIVAGGRIFVTCEAHDLVCIEKASGRILWIKSAPEFEGLSDEERKATPAYEQTCAPLSAQLEKLNQEAVAALNTNGGKAADGVLQKRKETQRMLLEAMKAIDKKKYDRYWAQGVFGWAGQTPVCDGKHVAAFYTTGITACYDLDGNRTWIAYGRGGGSEHGNFASPIMIANKVIVWANEMRAYDVETGKLAWSIPAKGSNTYGSMFRVDMGGEPVAAFQCGYFARVRDGQALWGENVFGDAVPTPVVENGTIYAEVGYPRNNTGLGFKAFKVPANESAKLAPSVTFKTEWADNEIPAVKDKTPFDRSYSASPLYHDGLIYRMTEGGGLIVNDAASGEVVYRKVLPMKPITKYWDWAGASACPTFAGKYIYLSDNQGVTVVIEPGRTYKEVARNVLEDTSDGRKQSQNLATPFFEGTRMYYRAPAMLYCIGEK